jgi:hypothetical protein
MTEVERLKKQISELVVIHQLDQAEIVRLRRWIEKLEEDKCSEQ